MLSLAAGQASRRLFQIFMVVMTMMLLETTAFAQEAHRAGIPLTVQRVGTMFTPFFTPSPVSDHAAARATDRVAYGRFFHAMLEAGIYLAPSAFEAGFTSSAHRTPELEHFARALPAALRATER